METKFPEPEIKSSKLETLKKKPAKKAELLVYFKALENKYDRILRETRKLLKQCQYSKTR